MYEIVFKTVITFFVVYALLDIIVRVTELLFNKDNDTEESTFIVVKVLNQEKNLEYIIRSIIWKNLTAAKGGKLPTVLIVDMGSTDETPEIASRLARDYPFIHCTDIDDYERIKDTFGTD